MKQFRIEAKLRNNKLIAAREALGFTSCPKAAAAIGVPYYVLVEYESLRRSPWRNTEGPAEWNDSAVRIANAYRCLPEDLWTDAVRDVKSTRSSIAVDVIPSGLLEAPKTPEQMLLEADTGASLQEAIHRLTPMEADIVRRRYGLDDDNEEHTYSEIGKPYALSGERTRQIQLRAEKKMRDYLTGTRESVLFWKQREERERQQRERDLTNGRAWMKPGVPARLAVGIRDLIELGMTDPDDWCLEHVDVVIDSMPWKDGTEWKVRLNKNRVVQVSSLSPASASTARTRP